jgi:heme-degrading monooxygenase HmoA
MHTRLAIYNFSGDAHDLGRRAEQGILPIFQSQPGFQAYSVAAGDGKILSLSVWDSATDAKAGNEAASAWVAENMASELDLIEVHFAELLFSTALGVSTTAAVAT